MKTCAPPTRRASNARALARRSFRRQGAVMSAPLRYPRVMGKPRGFNVLDDCIVAHGLWKYADEEADVCVRLLSSAPSRAFEVLYGVPSHRGLYVMSGGRFD